MLKWWLFRAETLIFGWCHPQVGKTSKNQKQTEHQTNYNEYWCFLLCSQSTSSRLYLFFISLTANQKVPHTRPPLACQSPPWGNELERDKRGREQAKARESASGGGNRCESGLKKQKKPQGWDAGESRACGVIAVRRSSLLKRDEWMGSGTPRRIQRERVTNQQCDSLLKI